jgi:hypothetical protein
LVNIFSDSFALFALKDYSEFSSPLLSNTARHQCLETQTPVSMPLPCDKSQKQPPGQLSLGAIQVVPHAALVFGLMTTA